MALAPQYVEKEHYSEAEYFEFERTAFGRWEYVKGQIRQMSGGTTDHGAISSNIIRVLGNFLVYLGKRDIVLNPLLVVDVLSPSTEGYDRGGKFVIIDLSNRFENIYLSNRTRRRYYCSHAEKTTGKCRKSRD